VPNLQKVPFYFNGPQAYLASNFQSTFGDQVDQQQMERCISQIQQRQPFSNAGDFLQCLLQECWPALCKTTLHAFEACSARVERFTIVAQIER
jgi:hypothetical protein